MKAKKFLFHAILFFKGRRINTKRLLVLFAFMSFSVFYLFSQPIDIQTNTGFIGSANPYSGGFISGTTYTYWYAS